MQPFVLSSLYSSLIPSNYQLDGCYFSGLNVDLTLTPSFEDAYQDRAPSVTRRQRSADRLLPPSPEPLMSGPWYQFLVEELFPLPPQLQLPRYAPPTSNGALISENKDVKLNNLQTTQDSQRTSSIDTTLALPSYHGNSGITFVDCSSPIVKSQIEMPTPSNGPVRFKHANSSLSAPSTTVSAVNLKRVTPRKTRLASDTNKHRYKCEKCERTFSRPVDKKRHERTTVRHGAIKKYPCGFCKVRLSRQADVARHEEKCAARIIM